MKFLNLLLSLHIIPKITVLDNIVQKTIYTQIFNTRRLCIHIFNMRRKLGITLAFIDRVFAFNYFCPYMHP